MYYCNECPHSQHALPNYQYAFKKSNIPFYAIEYKEIRKLNLVNEIVKFPTICYVNLSKNKKKIYNGDRLYDEFSKFANECHKFQTLL
jgi:hypothetical protein